MMQLLRWMSHLELSGSHFSERDIGRLMPEPALAISINGDKEFNNQHKNENIMKSKNRMLKWLALLFVLVASTIGTWAQGPTGLTQSGDHTVCFGETKHYGVNLTANSTYAWTITSLTGGANGTWVGGINNANLVGITWTSDGTTVGTAKLELFETNNSGGCSVLVSLTVTVLPQLTAPIINASQTICYNSVPTGLTIPTLPTGGNNSFTYQWQNSPNGTSGWTDISGATSSTYAPPALTATTYYQVVVTATGAQSCGIVPPSNVVTITVLPQLTAPAIASSQTICYNAVPSGLTMPTLPTGGNGTYTYQWQSSADGTTGWTDISGATSSTYAPPSLTATTYYHVISTATGTEACGIMPTSNVVSITVLPQLTAPVIASSQTICYNTVPTGLTTPTLPTGGNGTYTYQWQSSADGTTGWTDISGATSSTYAPPALTATTYYHLIATATGAQTCGIMPTSNVVTITVNPLPTPLITGTDPICGGDAETYSTPSVAGVTYTWTVVGGTFTGQGTNQITVTWNTTLVVTSGSVSVEETIGSSGCKATDTKNIVVNPKPTTTTIYHD